MMFTCAMVMILSFLPSAALAGEVLTIAVASSWYPDIKKQAAAFEKQHRVTVRLVSGSTGRLYNQIMQGAPFDLFVAADEKHSEQLREQGKANVIVDVGEGYLGVMSGKKMLSDPSQLIDSTIRRIAIANPEVAPFGRETKRLLEQQGLWHRLKTRFIYAQNAMQARMMVDKGLVDAGFVPVQSGADAIAVIHYRGVLLRDKRLAMLWLKDIWNTQDSDLKQSIHNPMLQKRIQKEPQSS